MNGGKVGSRIGRNESEVLGLSLAVSKFLFKRACPNKIYSVSVHSEKEWRIKITLAMLLNQTQTIIPSV